MGLKGLAPRLPHLLLKQGKLFLCVPGGTASPSNDVSKRLLCIH